MKVHQGIYGFIAGEPQLTWNEDGKARFYARIGINHFEQLPNGAFRKLQPTFHHLVQFGRGAELSHERFRKGDDFIALGYVREYPQIVDGQPRTGEQFVAYRISHDPNTTSYQIDRRPPSADRDTRRSGSPAAELPTRSPSGREGAAR